MDHTTWIKLFITVKVLLMVFCVSTSYVPDEYWQSLEVAHKLAFGYGYLTWEWVTGIRSYSYPLAIAGLYKLLEYVHLDSVYNLITLPRIFQAIIGIVTECYFVAWYKEQTHTQGKWAVVVVSTSWFWLYNVTRTLTNNVEMCLTTIGLYLFPWTTRNTQGQTSFLWMVGLACVVRPTAIVVWIPLLCDHIMRSPNKLRLILTSYMPIMLLILTASTALDSIVQGTLVFTPWHFIYANVFQGIGKFYGSNPFLWYFAVGMPTILGIHCPPFLMGCTNIFHGVASSVEILLLVVIGWTLAVFSFVSHKEFRFLLPILPMIWFISAKWLGRWSCKAKVYSLWFAALSLVIGCFVPLTYVAHYHQRGTLDVMPLLAKSALENPNDTNLLFLMPCHSTPLYSHIHVNVTARFLTCEPDFTGADGYTDEADLFHLNSEVWLKKNFNSNSSLPTHIIHFDKLVPQIQNFLTSKNYVMTAKFFHTHFPDKRVGGYVLVHQRFPKVAKEPMPV